MEIVNLLARLRSFAERHGLLLLTLVLFADAFASVFLKLPLLDALSVEHASPRTAVLALVGLSLFPMVSRFISALLRVVVSLLRYGLSGLGLLFQPASILAKGFDAALRFEDDDKMWKWKQARENRSKRLVALALTGCGPALEVYNERVRRGREESDVANYCLTFIVMFCGSLLVVGRRSLAGAGWSALMAASSPCAAKVLAAFFGWVLLVQGLHPPPDVAFEVDVARALPGSGESREPGAGRGLANGPSIEGS